MWMNFCQSIKNIRYLSVLIEPARWQRIQSRKKQKGRKGQGGRTRDIGLSNSRFGWQLIPFPNVAWISCSVNFHLFLTPPPLFQITPARYIPFLSKPCDSVDLSYSISCCVPSILYNWEVLTTSLLESRQHLCLTSLFKIIWGLAE